VWSTGNLCGRAGDSAGDEGGDYLKKWILTCANTSNTLWRKSFEFLYAYLMPGVHSTGHLDKSPRQVTEALQPWRHVRDDRVDAAVARSVSMWSRIGHPRLTSKSDAVPSVGARCRPTATVIDLWCSYRRECRSRRRAATPMNLWVESFDANAMPLRAMPS